jgi:hypothetical protein
MQTEDQPKFSKPKDPQSRLSNYEAEERAVEAGELLKSPIFQNAVDDVYSRHIGILISAEVGSLTASAAHAMIKALEEIRGQLEQYVTDHKMRQKYHKGD